MKCIIILSTKSSGSSALQNLLCRFGGGKHVEHTRHAEHETLYWTKAASVLGLPQVRLPDSEVPIPKGREERDIRRLLARNVPEFDPPGDTRQLIFDGWRALCAHYADVFVEKSPHHLHQWSVLELLATAAREMTDIDFRFVGLVRNPVDALYSGWVRRRTLPQTMQHHWKMAYDNLARWRAVVGERLTTVRYEDLSARPIVEQLFQTLGLPVQEGADRYIHGESGKKWQADPRFTFGLDPAVKETALSYGYRDSDLDNQTARTWQIYSVSTRLAHRTRTIPASVRRWAKRLT